MKQIACTLAARMPLDVDEVFSVGLAEAWRMLPQWRPDQGTLSTFLALRVRGAMLDHVRRMDWVPRLTRIRAKESAAAERSLEARLQRPPTDDDFAAAWGVTLDEAAARRLAAVPVVASSLQAKQYDRESGDEVTFAQTTIDVRAPSPTDRLERLDLLRIVTKGLRKIPRLVVILYFFEGYRMRDIGREVGLSESRVSQVLAEILADLRVRLASRAEDLFALLAG